MGEHLPGGQATSSLGDQATWLKEILHQADEKTVKVKSRLMTYTKLYIIYIYIYTPGTRLTFVLIGQDQKGVTQVSFYM